MSYSNLTKAQLIDLLEEKDEQIKESWPEFNVYMSMLVKAEDHEQAMQLAEELLEPAFTDYCICIEDVENI